MVGCRSVDCGSGGQRRVAQLGDRLALDLAHALGGDAPDARDVGQLGLAAVQQAVAAAHDVGGALVEAVEHVVEAGAVLGVEHDLVGAGRRVAGQQVAEGGVAVLLDRGVERDVVAGQAEQFDDALLLEAELVGEYGGTITAYTAEIRVALNGDDQ